MNSVYLANLVIQPIAWDCLRLLAMPQLKVSYYSFIKMY